MILSLLANRILIDNWGIFALKAAINMDAFWASKEISKYSSQAPSYTFNIAGSNNQTARVILNSTA